MVLHPAGALALRRSIIALVAVLVTMGAHLAGAGHGLSSVNLSVAAVAVGTAGLTALLVGRRAGQFRPRGPAATLGTLVVVQAGAHLVMWAAPWVVGLEMHHDVSLVAPAMVLTHAVATVVLVPLLVGMERVLAALVGVVRRLRRLFVRPACGAAWVRLSPSARTRRAPAPRVWCAPVRGPPAGSHPG